MSKRLQVVLGKEEYREIQRPGTTAPDDGVGMGAAILATARRAEPAVDAGRKLDVVRAAAGHEFPVADIEQLLEEIERGYVGDTG